MYVHQGRISKLTKLCRRASVSSCALALVGSLAMACEKKQEMAPEPQADEAEAEKAALKPEEATKAAVQAPSEAAVVGKPAPNFTLVDTNGKEYSLSQFQGSTVVLEWFNPDCPFVKAAHGPGSLNGLAAKHSKDTVWLAINSGGKGKQGNGIDHNKKSAEAFGMTHPVLIDESGAVGKLYGAERTPHMYVVDPKGVLVYKGAIDNSPDGEGKSPAGGELVNYVENALSAIREGKPVEPAETNAYGCGVKYGES